MQPVAPVTLEGRSVRLEPLSLSHLDALLVAATASRDSFRWTTVPPDRATMQQAIESALAEQAHGVALPFATIRKSSQKVVGSTQFMCIERWRWPGGSSMQRAPNYTDAVEIGRTWLAPDAQRSEVNSEAKLLMLDHAFTVWNVHRVTLKTDLRNARSRAAIERIGGKLDGLFRGHMPGADETVRTTAFFSILADEWPALRIRLQARIENCSVVSGSRS